MPFLHPVWARIRQTVPLWVAVASGLGGVLLTIGAAALFTLLGGPVTISVSEEAQAAPPFAATGPATTTPRPPALVGTTPPTTPPSTGAPTPTPSRVNGYEPPTYLKNLDTPTGGMYQARPQTMSSQRYEEAFKLYCGGTSSTPTRTSWKVSGFSRFTAVIGIADDEGSALNTLARVSVQDEHGANLTPPFEVSLGRPRPVDIAITGIVQLQVFATCRNAQTDRSDDSYITLGDAALR